MSAVQPVDFVSHQLKSGCSRADNPLFSRCSAAVISLFSGPRQKPKMTLNQEIAEQATTLPQTAEQQISAEPPAAPLEIAALRPRGRPWVKGQSGNPAGRPSRARQAAL